MSRILLALLLCGVATVTDLVAQPIPISLQARILQLEDERNPGGSELTGLLKSRSGLVRERVALALGRIGDRQATPALIETMQRDRLDAVRRMAAFALGEIEDPAAIAPLLKVLDDRSSSPALRARAAEALGKIPGLPDRGAIAQALVRQLPAASQVLTNEQSSLASLVITALMRVRAEEAIGPLAAMLGAERAEIRADAANALARIRLPLAEKLPVLISSLDDPDPDVRANVARALGVARDARAFEPLMAKLADVGDGNDRAQVAVVRALGAIADLRAPEGAPERVTGALVALGQSVLNGVKPGTVARPASLKLLFEIATVLSNLRGNNFQETRAIPFLTSLRRLVGVGASAEVEQALATFGPEHFFRMPDDHEDDHEDDREDDRESGFSTDLATSKLVGEARRNGGVGNLARALAIIGDARSREMLLWLWGSEPADSIARPEILRALAKLKPLILPEILREAMEQRDPIVRAAAAELVPPSAAGLTMLKDGYQRSLGDPQNDGRLAILRAIGGYREPAATTMLEAALRDPDHLVRRLAVDLLHKRGATDVSSRIGIVRTDRPTEYYLRLARRLEQPVSARILTEKGVIEVDLFRRDAPMTVENLITLARRGYFDRLAFHRVVANFVIQGGDPRGDGEGGPGYQIRCEVNTRPYLRGTLGMALSGKDTGGSQFFITHSSQPHLDGGYTVFGQVRKGIEVVDQITRGDRISEIVIVERSARPELSPGEARPARRDNKPLRQPLRRPLRRR